MTVLQDMMDMCCSGEQPSATLTAGFGLSTAESTAEAASEAVTAAMAKLIDPSSPPSIAFVSATVKRDVEDVRKELVKNLPDGTPIQGITSSGSILTAEEGCKVGALACLVLKSSDENAFATAFDGKDASTAADTLKEKMASPQAIVLGSTPGAEEGAIEVLSKVFPGVPVYGGTAADDKLSGAWAVLSSGESSGTGVSLVGVGQSVKFGASMLGPYEPTDKTALATKTVGRRVHEIDGKPAADWVYEWLGEDVKEQYENGGLIMPQTALKPIGIKQPSGEFVINHLAAFGGADKWVDFFAPIAEKSELVVMNSGDGPTTGYSSALSEAYETAKSAGTLQGENPAAGILIFCGGMAIAVGDKLDDGLMNPLFRERVKDLPMLGMLCYGEQSCLPKEQRNVQRNLSVGMILFG